MRSLRFAGRANGPAPTCSEADLHAFGGGTDFGVIILGVGDYFVYDGVGMVGS